MAAWLRANPVIAFIWVGLLAGGIAMAVWAGQADRFPGDLAVARWIQNNDVAGREVSDFLRDVGSGLAVAVTLGVVIAALLLMRRPRWAAAAAPLFLGLLLIWGLKHSVGRPRTSIEFLEQRATFDSLSFPSGHVMGGTLVMALVLYLCCRLPAPLWVRLPAGTWALGVLLLGPWISVSSGVHWPSDVLGGLVWAGIVLIPLLLVFERLRGSDGRTC